MASITHESSGRRTIQFVGDDGRRRSLRLGKVSKAQAEAVKGRVEALVACKVTGQAMSRDLALWVTDLGETLHSRLVSVGLVSSRAHQGLGELLDACIAAKPTVKPGTRITYYRVRGYLVEFFGERAELRKLTAADADRWWSWMIGERGLSEATARKSVQVARQFMKVGIRNEALAADPFEHLTGTVRSNPARVAFVDQETIQRVIDACPDAEWRLIVALARYGGLRIPSELNALRWSDVLWDQHRFVVHASKTEHHRHGGIRPVPLFSELLPYLRDAFELAPVGAEFVVSRRDSAVNLRTHFMRIIRRAGAQPWPKLFQNLRASRQTELAKEYPLHLVTAWIGNTPAVAMGHYLQVRDTDFQEAALGKAVQNPVQQAAVASGTVGHGVFSERV